MQDNWALGKLAENTVGYITTRDISTKALRRILLSVLVRTNTENQISLCCKSMVKICLHRSWYGEVLKTLTLMILGHQLRKQQEVYSQYSKHDADVSQTPLITKRKHLWVQSPLPQDFR